MRTLTRAESKVSDNGNQAIRAQQAAQNFSPYTSFGQEHRAEPYSDGLRHFEPFSLRVSSDEKSLLASSGLEKDENQRKISPSSRNDRCGATFS
jgi:hypothetical protein